MSEGTIEINYTPIKRVKIMDVTQLSLTELAKRVQAMTQLGRPTLLNWAEGVAFLSIPMRLDSDALVEKILEGEMVIQNIVYALMPEYKPTIKVQTYDVYILNQTPSRISCALGKWLKKTSSE
jgi:hypothetical protein